MQHLRYGAVVALSLSALTGLAVCAQQTTKPDAAVAEAIPAKATLDKPVQDFKLADVMHDKKEGEKADDAMIALSKFKDKKSVVLFFMSEQCQVTWRYEKRVGKLMSEYGKKDVAFLGVRCSANDTPVSIRKFAESKNFEMPVLNDEKGKMTSFFKVTNTPSFALIDKKGVLRYFGSFDDAPDEPDVTKKYLPDAISAVLTNKTVAVTRTKPFG